MKEIQLISFIIAFGVGIVAIKKFGISDNDILDIFYGKKRGINSIADSMFRKNKAKEKQTHESIGLSNLQILLLILQELKKGVTNPIKISESSEIPLDYLMKFFDILVDQGLIDHENENVFLRKPVEINTGLKITKKGESTLIYFNAAENAIEGIKAPEFDNERNV